jgi:GTP-binding protein
MNEVFNLFCELDTPNELLDYPLFFSSGRDGWVR